jgi:hypothetical protein
LTITSINTQNHNGFGSSPSSYLMAAV